LARKEDTVLPEDFRHALEVRWEARLAFDLLPADSQRDCIGWIEESPVGWARYRRIDIVLTSLRPGVEGTRVEQRYRDRLKALALPAA
jgi:uncharacterized protein YdeI (YjbR/CyaY-like superfamily)